MLVPLQRGNDAPASGLKQSLGSAVGQLRAWRAKTPWWCPASEQGLWKGSFGMVLEAVPPAWAAPGLLLLGFCCWEVAGMQGRAAPHPLTCG